MLYLSQSTVAGCVVADRVLPHNLDAERSLLGAILIENRQHARVASIVTDASFFRDAHRRIFKHIGGLVEAGVEADLVTLCESLRVSGELDEAGGMAYVSSLVDGVPRATNAEYYAGIVRDKKRLRDAIFLTSTLTASAYEEESPSTIVEQALSGFSVLARDGDARSMVSARDTIANYVATLDDRPDPIATGFLDVDALLRGGLRPADLMIIAARPSVGKSSFALGLADHASRAGHGVAFFSLEMSAESLVARQFSWQSRVPSERIERKLANAHEYAQVTTALESNSSTMMIETLSRTVSEVSAWCRRLKQEMPIDPDGRPIPLSIVVVDYLQLLSPDRRGRDTEADVSEISRSLKRLAKELNVAVVALSQLSRASEARRDKRPQTSDLRSSGALEQDADIVVLLFREEMYIRKPENHGIAEAIIAKQRNGSTGTVRLAFTSELSQFRNLAPGDL